MYTSTLLFVLTVQATQGAEISWSDDYGQAQRQGIAEKKPLAVFLGKGAEGYDQLVRPSMSKAASDYLAAHYVCVYVDTTSPSGEKLAKAFKLKVGQAVVLSDRTGVYEKFRQEGTMNNKAFLSQLKQNNSTAASAAGHKGGSGSGNYGGGYGGCYGGGCSTGGCYGGSCGGYAGGCYGGSCGFGGGCYGGGCGGGRCR